MRMVGGDAEATLLESLRERMVLAASGLGLCVRHDRDDSHALGRVANRIVQELKEGRCVESCGILTAPASFIRRSIEATAVEVRAETGASARAAF
jgi:hypothetical protein